jgi:hypothetical protein
MQMCIGTDVSCFTLIEDKILTEFILLCCGKLVATCILPSNTTNVLDPTMHVKHVACIVESGFHVFDGNI